MRTLPSLRLKISHHKAIEKLKFEIGGLKKQLQAAKSDHSQLLNKTKDSIWEKVEVHIDQRPVEQFVLQAQKVATSIKTAVENLSSELVKLSTDIKDSLKSKVELETIRENLKNITGFMEIRERYVSEQLTHLAYVVNEMENQLKQGMPAELRNIGMHSAAGMTSPTLMCIQLKEECVRINAEYANLKMQLSAEASSNLESLKELQKQHQQKASQLNEMTQKYLKEKEEKENILSMIQDKEGGIFDAIKFKKVQDENENLKQQLAELNHQLFEERHLNINTHYNEQESLAKIATLRTEVDHLRTIKKTLSEQLQSQDSVRALEQSKYKTDLERLEKENKLCLSKFESLTRGFQALKASISDGDYARTNSELESLSLFLAHFSNELSNMKHEQFSKASTVDSLISSRIESLNSQIQKASSSLIDILGKDDRAYLSQITGLEGELDHFKKDKSVLESRLTESHNQTQLMASQMASLQDKLNIYKSLDDHHPLPDNPLLDVGNTMDLDRVTKVLSKSLNMIAVLNSQISELKSQSEAPGASGNKL